MQIKVLIFLFSLIVSKFAMAQNCTLAATIDDAIGASTFDYITRTIEASKQKGCHSILLRINTPGGSLHSTRLIVEQILASPVPFMCLITPQGGHAGSAGAIILQACHLNGAVKTTNIGAATPIIGTGQETPSDLRKKMINDTVSWLEGITKLRNRNLKFSKEIVTEAKSITSEEAHKIGALDFIADNEKDFLSLCRGKSVVINSNSIQILEGDILEFLPDWRYKVLNFFADPEMSYMIFMGSLALLYLEFTNPGLIAPGVVGGIGLILSLISFHKLDVSWGGLLLLLLGIVFLIAEMFVPSFGALGIGGVIAMVLGSLFLFDAEKTGFTLSLSVILPFVFIIASVFLGLGWFTIKSIRQKTKDSDYDLTHADGVVVSIRLSEADRCEGQVELAGETWNFYSNEQLKVGDHVSVIKREGLNLKIKKKEV